MYMRFSESRRKKVHIGGFTKIRSDAGIFISFGSIAKFYFECPSVQVYNFGTKKSKCKEHIQRKRILGENKALTGCLKVFLPLEIG